MRFDEWIAVCKAAAAEGEVRHWASGDHVKQNGKWVRVKDGGGGSPKTEEPAPSRSPGDAPPMGKPAGDAPPMGFGKPKPQPPAAPEPQHSAVERPRPKSDEASAPPAAPAQAVSSKYTAENWDSENRPMSQDQSIIDGIQELNADNALKDYWEGEKATVPIDRLLLTEPPEGGLKRKVEGIMQDPKAVAKPIFVVRDAEGNFHVADGHHRVEANRRLGNEKMKVKIIDASSFL